jgi:hypothetical protein
VLATGLSGASPCATTCDPSVKISGIIRAATTHILSMRHITASLRDNLLTGQPDQPICATFDAMVPDFVRLGGETQALVALCPLSETASIH